MKEYLIWLAKLITILILILIAIPLLIGGLLIGTQEKLAEQFKDSDKVVAVVELNGVINSAKEIIDSLQEKANDKTVKGIVLRINSPGGSVAPSQEINAAVARLSKRKPIVASMGSIAASGGLYASLSASKVFCQPGTLTGSIGVIVQMPNFTKVSRQLGVDVVTIKSGELKDVGNPFREMSEKERNYLEETVNQVQEEFVDAVVKGRKIKREQVLKFADGRVLIGSKALELGLVDKFGGLHEAAREVFEILGKPLKDHESPKLVYTEDKLAKIKKLLESVLELPLQVSDSSFGRRFELMYLM